MYLAVCYFNIPLGPASESVLDSGWPKGMLVLTQGCFLAFFSKLKDRNFKTQAIFWPKLKDFFSKTHGFFLQNSILRKIKTPSTPASLTILASIFQKMKLYLQRDISRPFSWWYQMWAKTDLFLKFQWESSKNRPLKTQAIFINSTKLQNSSILYQKLKDFCSKLNISETK